MGMLIADISKPREGYEKSSSKPRASYEKSSSKPRASYEKSSNSSRRLQRLASHFSCVVCSANTDDEVALIVGAGSGISAAVARLCKKQGMKVAVASRSGMENKATARLVQDGAIAYKCDASDASSVEGTFAKVVKDFGKFPDFVLYNASGGGSSSRGPITGTDPEMVKKALLVSAYGGYLVGREAAIGMVKRGSGSIFFTGASASYKGYAKSSSFAMGKFGLHGLAQAMARELYPKGIHVAHFPIDGGVGKINEDGEKTSHWSSYKATTTGSVSGDGVDSKDTMLDPRAIAETYLFVHRQHRSAWTFDVVLRPWGETW